MSVRALRWWFWLAALVALPAPFAGIGSARVPPLHQLELGALALGFTVLERAQGIGPLVSTLFLGQALVWGAALWLPAALLARAFAKLPPHVRTRLAVSLVVLGLALASVEPVYRTPYSSRSAHSALLDVYR